MNRNQRLYGIPAIARTPMSTYCVGIRILLNPSPNWKASTATCLLTPTRSASGAIIGMVTKACPLPDGMKKFARLCTKNIPTAERAPGSS